MQAVKTAARPAQAISTSKHRVSMIAKIQIGKKQIGLDDDDYRKAIVDISKQPSLSACSDVELVKMLDWLKSKGFRTAPRKGAATHPMAGKARALWISLHQLGAVQNPREEALEAFAKRQLGCDRLAWANQSQAFRLVEALKSIAIRHGWQQHDRSTGKAFLAVGLQNSLCCAILVKMKETGIASECWSIEEAARDLCGIKNPRTEDDYKRLAKALGDALRKHGGKAHG